MRITRYIVIVAGIVAVIAATAWFLRNDLIQRLSNPLLANYGLTIADVSLDALATGDASISYLELVHEKGTSIVIENLTLPYAAASKKAKTYRAEKVSVFTATRTDGATFELAELIRQVLSLPDNLANSAFVVDEFSLPPYPTFRDVRWEIADNSQRLDGSVDSIELSATLARGETGSHDVTLSVPAAQAAGDGNTLGMRLLDDEARLSLTGGGSLNLPTWEALAKLVGVVPTELEISSGTATLSVDVEIPNDAARTPTLAASLTPTSELAASYRSDSSIATILVKSAGITHLAAAFPDVDWSLKLAEAALTVSYGEWTEIPLSLTDVACKSGPVCSITSRITINKRRLPIGNVAVLEYSSTENLHFLDSGVRIDVQPGASLKLRDVRSPSGGLKRMQAELVSPARLDLSDAGWRLGRRFSGRKDRKPGAGRRHLSFNAAVSRERHRRRARRKAVSQFRRFRAFDSSYLERKDDCTARIQRRVVVAGR